MGRRHASRESACACWPSPPVRTPHRMTPTTSTELDPGPPLGKEDSAGVPALSATADYSDSQAWVVTNQWEDKTTPAARAAGMAWPADSGLTWNEKYAAWIELVPVDRRRRRLLDDVQAHDAVGQDRAGARARVRRDVADSCASRSPRGTACRSSSWRSTAASASTSVTSACAPRRARAGTPDFALAVQGLHEETRRNGATWPKDRELRARHPRRRGRQAELGAGAVFGTYLDEIHLNKRVALLHDVRPRLPRLGEHRRHREHVQPAARGRAARRLPDARALAARQRPHARRHARRSARRRPDAAPGDLRQRSAGAAPVAGPGSDPQPLHRQRRRRPDPQHAVRRHDAVLASQRRAQAVPRREGEERRVVQHVDERRRGELDQRYRLRPRSARGSRRSRRCSTTATRPHSAISCSR